MPYRISLLILPLTLAAATAAGAQAPSNVRVTARVVVVDRGAASRAGVSYVTLADGRVQVTPAAQSRGSLAVRGPLGIASVAKNVATLGHDNAEGVWDKIYRSGLNLLQLAALIAVRIGVMNLLPVPGLDVGHLMLYA